MKHLSKFNETVHVSDESIHAMEETIKDMAAKFIKFCRSFGVKKDISSLERAVQSGSAEEIKSAYASVVGSSSTHAPVTESKRINRRRKF